MKRQKFSLRLQIVTLVGLSLVLVWAAAFSDLYRSRQAYLHEAEVRSAVEAQVFAEYSRSTLKRVNEFILEARSRWNGDWVDFSELVKRSQETIDDITFQVSIIDKDGLLAFSNLAKPADRTDLSQREHFRVHKDAPSADRLFISKPLLGKVSGKWSLQVTRPIFKAGVFDGVVVVSLSPDQFAGFAEKMGIGKNSAMTVVRNTGEIMARYPATSTSLGLVLKERPFLAADSPLAGTYRQVSASDGTERIWGYYKLPEYGMTFVMGEAVKDILEPYDAHVIEVVAGAAAVSLLAVLLFMLLSRSLTALQDRTEQLNAIFALSPDGFVSFDNKRRVKYASPSFRRMTGLDETKLAGLDESAFGRRLAELCISRARLPAIAALRKSQADRAANVPEQDESRQRHLIELAVPNARVLEVGLRLSNAETVSQILYFRDVTHETEVDRMKSEFLSTAAHELRTPMASIYGFAELLLTQELDAETSKDLLNTIYRQSELMASIINELLDLSRIEARRGKDFVFETLNLVDVVDQAVAGYKRPEGREAPQLIAPDATLQVSADRKKLQQAVTNLLSNAYKYSPQGGAIDIRYRTDASGDEVMVGIAISDHGIGMTAEQLARVFERFYRADTSGKIPGTGLGMSIVKEIVDIHRGRIDIQSEIGQGTSVIVWLPAVDATAESLRVSTPDAA